MGKTLGKTVVGVTVARVYIAKKKYVNWWT